MKFNNKKKILSIFFASIISSSAIATATYSIVSTKKTRIILKQKVLMSQF